MIRQWLERIGIRWYVGFRGGHRYLSLGPVNITLYALDTAMHGALNVFVPRIGYICIKPPTKSFGAWWPAYFYISSDATPHRARISFGRAEK